MPTLTLQNGERAGETFTFDRPIVIGRGRKADVSIDDPSASRRHAGLEFVGSSWQVADLDSANGTLLNGRPVSRPTTVRPGDLIAVGTSIFRYDEPEPVKAGSTDTVFSVVEDSPPSQILLRAPVDTSTPATATDGSASLLARLAELLGTAFDEGAILDFVLQELLAAIPRAERGLVLVQEPASGLLLPRAVRTRQGRPPEMSYSRAILAQALQRREGLVIVDASRDALSAGSHSMLLLGVRSVLCVPITFRNDVYGIVQLESEASVAPFGRPELATAVGLAAQIGMALAFARMHARELERELLERDLALARRVQQDFLPQQPPEVPGYGFAVEYTPALAVGGDFYDFLRLSPTHVGVMLGDVSGKGVSAAIFAARVTSDFRYQSAGHTDAVTILERVNRSLAYATRDGMFATVAIAVVDTGSGQMQLASAGHPLGLLRRGDGTCDYVGVTGGPPVGIREKAKFPAITHQLLRGDSMLFFSDGVTEAIDPVDEQYGTDRIVTAVRAAGRSTKDITRALYTDLVHFMNGKAQRDDITIVSFGRD